MLTKEAIAELEKQQYRIIGSHSAVKTCGWTKTMIKGEGGCYKLKFYGIMSNQCMQMTTSISCANRCTFCWRGYKAPVSKEWQWGVDEPEFILKGSLDAHHQLLIGFNHSQKANQASYQASKTVKHVALSLTGEPIIYPRINELLEKFNRDGISTFLVTNAQYPEQIKSLKPITQLYISLDAPNKEILKEVDKPLFPDYYERLLQSLQYLKEKKERTCIRVTLIKGINDLHLEQWAEMIMKGDPDFIEVKAYMFVGESRERLKRENMPLHEEVVKFSQRLAEFLPDYELMSEHIPSRVVLFTQKKFKIDNEWKTWIDFPRWHELVNSNKEFSALDYCKKTPGVGISGKGTIDRMPADVRERWLKKHNVDEQTQEMEFYEKEG